MYNTIVRFFQDGGLFMYPIAVVLTFGLAIALERYLFLTKAKITNRKAFNELMPLLKKKEYNTAHQVARSIKAPLADIIAAGLFRTTQSPRREDVEYAMEESVMEALPPLEKRTQYLATLANVATLLGLLGTIIGLIAAFTAVANADPSEKASLLSQSISVAMNTTAFGLITAIPLLLTHALLQTKTAEIVDGFEMAGVKFMNILSGTRITPAQTRTTDNS
ncbi:MAG: MotA/TolQ/ExbB proton channel family protein [Pseudomonadales bacterium]|nr:MotA/TolQ/ExbB proton channel family protein [Pseudomonadales bacterium]